MEEEWGGSLGKSSGKSLFKEREEKIKISGLYDANVKYLEKKRIKTIYGISRK
jgi:hypothetical protein